MNDKAIFAGLAVLGIALVLVASGRTREAAGPAGPMGPGTPGVVDPASTLPEGHPPIQAPATAQPGPTGTVQEALSGGGYTYVRFKTDEEEYWVAGPTTELEPGDSVSLSGTMEMGAFTSRTLGRDFDRLVFTNAYVQR